MVGLTALHETEHQEIQQQGQFVIQQGLHGQGESAPSDRCSFLRHAPRSGDPARQKGHFMPTPHEDDADEPHIIGRHRDLPHAPGSARQTQEQQDRYTAHAGPEQAGWQSHEPQNDPRAQPPAGHRHQHCQCDGREEIIHQHHQTGSPGGLHAHVLRQCPMLDWHKKETGESGYCLNGTPAVFDSPPQSALLFRLGVGHRDLHQA